MTEAPSVVLDASAAIDFVLGRVTGGAPVVDMIAPEWFEVEVLAGLTRMVRQDLIDVERMREALGDIRALDVAEVDLPPDALLNAIELACGHRSFYDARYLALAIHYGAEVWTTDARLRDEPGVRVLQTI